MSYIYIYIYATFSFGACQEDLDLTVSQPQATDSSREIVFSDFSPKEGAVRTQFYITGSNFGTDPSKIHVSIGGREAKVIGANGQTIYCMVPKRAYSGEVKVSIEDARGNVVASHVFDDTFDYHKKTTVGTLIRKVDERGLGLGNIAGPIEEAAFQTGAFLRYNYKEGEYDEIICGGWNSGIHIVDFMKGTFDLLIPYQHTQMRTFDFTADCDTLLIPDDNYDAYSNALPNIYYSVRSEGFGRLRPYHYGPCAFGVLSTPDHHLFYSTWNRGAIVKANGTYNAATKQWEDKTLFEVATFMRAGNGMRMHMILHPSGKFMYILGPAMMAILKSEYDAQTHEFLYPTVLCGAPEASGYVEATGSMARFSQFLLQGVFVKNRDYERQGKEDIYDFYLSDPYNHCIRRITPEGSVSLFAGRSNSTADGSIFGYVDGDPLKEARFTQPQGITYDERNETFYVAEWDNHSLRYITTE